MNTAPISHQKGNRVALSWSFTICHCLISSDFTEDIYIYDTQTVFHFLIRHCHGESTPFSCTMYGDFV